jgi:GTP-binding protein
VEPVVAIVGTPNVGKSTLFNRLTGTRNALVVDRPGVTRDYQVGDVRIGMQSLVLIDTGGVQGADDSLSNRVSEQAWRVAEDAGCILFMVDGNRGCTGAEESIATRLRKLGKPLFLVVNKTEGTPAEIAVADFQRLALGSPMAISAVHGDGIEALKQRLASLEAEQVPALNNSEYPRIAVVGRPNVGKSTLINRILGEERVLADDTPGTTRDSIAVTFEREGQPYVFVDTAGVRRKAKVSDIVEKFSIVKTLQAIDEANVVVFMLDSGEGVTEQDLALAGLVEASGRALLIAMNKWDGLTLEQRNRARAGVDRRLRFVDFAPVHFVSALYGNGLGGLFKSIQRAYTSAFASASTPSLNQLLHDAVERHQPPLVRGRRVKLRFAHMGGHNPPRVIIHGNQVDNVPRAYHRYLERFLRDALKLYATPLRVEFKQNDNPFKGRRNVLTKRQHAKRQRLIRQRKKR